MRREWTIEIAADSNHLTVDSEGRERVGSVWIQSEGIQTLDLICDPTEDHKQLLKDALVALIERL